MYQIIKQYINLLRMLSIMIAVVVLLTLLLDTIFFNLPKKIFAQSTPPTSASYKLLDYGFGAGGTATSSSSNYSLFGTVGQVDQGSPSSSNYFVGAGLEYTISASTPAAPTFVNPANWYNKLKITINRTGNDAPDTQYAIRIASGSGGFQYVQNDNTIAPSFPLTAWQSYTAWGGATGTTIVGLTPGTQYIVQVAAKQGQFFTQGLWSPTAIASTYNSSLSFDIDIASTDTSSSPPYILNIGEINAGAITTSTNKVWITIGTNATNGGIIYVKGNNTGLLSSTASYTINTVTNDLTSVSEGYGIRSTSNTQTAGGPMEALAPYNGVSNNVGVIDTAKRNIYDSSGAPVTAGRVSFEVKAKASDTTPSANDYADTITVLATGSF